MIILTGQALEEIGKAMFGAHWQTEIAARLKCDPRSVRRWGNDQVSKPSRLRSQLIAMLEDQMHILSQHHERLGGRD